MIFSCQQYCSFIKRTQWIYFGHERRQANSYVYRPAANQIPPILDY